jgi:hypothetical protein
MKLPSVDTEMLHIRRTSVVKYGYIIKPTDKFVKHCGLHTTTALMFFQREN